MNLVTAVPALVGGALIGLAATMFLFTHGKPAGVSGLFAGLVSKPSLRGENFAFIAGLAAAGLAARFVWPSAFGPAVASLPLLLLAGGLVGFGTRMAGGCTSGHGVCGISRLPFRSLVATATFMATGFATVYVVRHLIGGG